MFFSLLVHLVNYYEVVGGGLLKLRKMRVACIQATVTTGYGISLVDVPSSMERNMNKKILV